jgi:predicted O-linked N-acetylglucosamine transferase (SPINDLY family)
MRPAAEHPYQRARLGIAPDAVVIGAFVTLLKFSRRCLALWRDVLTRVPRATIALSPQDLGLEPYYVRVFAAAGIGRERLVFVPQGGGEEHNLARYELLDMVLDPLPFGGVNGTMEALNMGVPVVTLCGRRHGERTSTSLLRYLGVVQTIATSGKEYVDIAERLATHPEFREEVRRDLRARLRDSPLADPTHYTRALESAYEAALERTAAGRRS